MADSRYRARARRWRTSHAAARGGRAATAARPLGLEPRRRSNGGCERGRLHGCPSRRLRRWAHRALSRRGRLACCRCSPAATGAVLSHRERRARSGASLRHARRASRRDRAPRGRRPERLNRLHRVPAAASRRRDDADADANPGHHRAPAPSSISPRSSTRPTCNEPGRRQTGSDLAPASSSERRLPSGLRHGRALGPIRGRRGRGRPWPRADPLSARGSLRRRSAASIACPPPAHQRLRSSVTRSTPSGPHRRLVVELDSFEFHRTARAFERDRARDAALAGRRLPGRPHHPLDAWHAKPPIASEVRRTARERAGSSAVDAPDAPRAC